MYKLNITDKDLVNIDIEDINEYIKHIEKLTNIKWKVIPDYEDYIISEYGDIISIRSKKVLEKILNKTGYYTIRLYRNDINKMFKIHRLVYSTFMNDKKIEGFSIHHKDQNKINNHYSNLEKMTNSDHKKYHNNLESEKDLKKYEEIYNDKIKNDLTNTQLSEKYNVSKNALRQGLKKYKLFLYSNKDKDIYNNLLKEEKNILLKDISIENKKDRAIKYLKECKKVYNLYRYGNKSMKEISKIFNIPESTVNFQIKNQRVYLYINEDLDKYITLSEKEKNNIYTNIILIDKQKENLKFCEEIYNRKQKENLTNAQLAKIFNTSEAVIKKQLKDQRIYSYLNRDFDKFNHLTNKERNDFYTSILINNQNTRNKEYLIECKQIYDDKIKNNLSNKKLTQKYNMSRSAIDKRIRDYYIYYYYLNEDDNKFNNLTYKERDELYNKIYNNNLIDKQKEYLVKYEQIYNDKIKNNLTNKQLAEKYDILENRIDQGIRNYKIFLYFNKDIDKFMFLSNDKKRNEFYSKIYNDNLIDDKKEFLDLCEEIYNRKQKENLTNAQLAKIFNLSISSIEYKIRDYYIYFHLNKDFDKFNKLSYKEKKGIYNKLLVENNNKEIIKLGKEIEKLKLTGLSISKIMAILNITKGKLRYTYKKYKKLLKNEELYKIN